MKKKRILYTFCGLLCIALVCMVYSVLRTPSIDIIYNYDGNAYVQNTRSFIKKKITLPEYSNISNVITTDDGWFCRAENNDKSYFLFVTEDNNVAKVLEDDFYFSNIDDAMVYNQMYRMVYTYQKTAGDTPKTAFLTVDFKNNNLIYDDYPPEFSSYSVISDGNSLWGSNGDMIAKFENNEYMEMTEGNSVIGVYGDYLMFEQGENICKLDLSTGEISDCEYNIDLNNYRTVDFESKLCFTDEYFIGCRPGLLKSSDGSSLITHTLISDKENDKHYILFGSVGKKYENIQILNNCNDYNTFAA